MCARQQLLATLAGLVAFASAHGAAASDARVRAAVDWGEQACAVTVDRSVEPVVHLDYAPTFEDPKLDPGEIEDGRRFQFFALCRENGPQEPLPQWITWDDVMAAGVAISKFDPMSIEADQVIDDAASGWPGCVARINGDDARLPITNAVAASGLDWDTTDLPVGVYTIRGYTWDPAINIWSDRHGFIKVHDGDPAAAGPAAAVTTLEQILYLDELATIQGCVDAGADATIDVYWSPADAIDWQPYLMDEPVMGGEFAFEYAPPESVIGDSSMLRVDVTDASGTYTAYMQELVVALNMSNPESCDEGGGFIGQPGCEDTGGDDTGDDGITDGGTATSGASADGTAGTSAGSGPTTTAMADGGDDGGGDCACRSGTGAGAGTLWLGLGMLGLAVRRRRR